jgi:hypothetical protein
MALSSEEPAQVRQELLQEPLPVPPRPTHPVEISDVVAPIAEPEAAKPRKAGAAKGEVKSASAKRKDPKAVAAKARKPKVKGSKRKENTRRS